MNFDSLIDMWTEVIGPELEDATDMLIEMQGNSEGFFHTFQFFRTNDISAVCMFRHKSGYDIVMNDTPGEATIRIVKDSTVVVDHHPKMFDTEWLMELILNITEPPTFDFSQN